MTMIEDMFEREFGKGRLEQVEAGVFLEQCEPVREDGFEEDDSDLMFGSMKIPACEGSKDAPEKEGIAEQLCGADLLREIPAPFALLPPVCGTSVMDFEYLLETQDYSYDLLRGASLTDITESLAQDCRVFCKVCASVVSEEPAALPAEEAFCLVEVRGIDLRDPDATRVCFEAFGSEYSVWQCSLNEFMKAWSASDRSCYVVSRESNHEY